MIEQINNILHLKEIGLQIINVPSPLLQLLQFDLILRDIIIDRNKLEL